MFSVVILTLNEERNLPLCLASISGCRDIVVLDSGSTDRTLQIAAAAGAHTVVNPFRDFAQQRNFAHEQIRFETDWILHLDADERLTPELGAECAQIAAKNPASLDGFYVAPRMLFRGQWIPRCTDFPAWQARFAHRTRFRFIQVGHGQREAPDLRLGYLHHSYLHDLSSHSEEELEAKHRRYARQEAERHLAEGAQARWLPPVFEKNALVRRRALKAWSYQLSARPMLRFLYQYGLRGGWRDGRAGLAYCRLMARYEGWISEEIRLRRQSARQA